MMPISQADVTGTPRKKGKLSTGQMDLSAGQGRVPASGASTSRRVRAHGACETCDFDKAAGLRDVRKGPEMRPTEGKDGA